jgi:hypothetical protein
LSLPIMPIVVRRTCSDLSVPLFSVGPYMRQFRKSKVDGKRPTRLRSYNRPDPVYWVTSSALRLEKVDV